MRRIVSLALLCAACATQQSAPDKDKPDVLCPAGEHVSLHGWCAPDHDFDTDADRAWARALLCGLSMEGQRPEFCDEVTVDIE